MSLTKHIILKIGIVVALLTSFVVVQAVYVPTNRDTKEPPEEVVYAISDPTDMEFLYETDNFKYYFRDSRDVIAIFDKRSGYTWKSGPDVEFSKDIDDECDEVIELYEAQFIDIEPTTFGDYIVTVANDENSINVLQGEVKVTINTLDETSLENDISLELQNLALVQNQTYRLTFDASARDARDIKVALGSDVAEIVTISTTADTYTLDFTMTQASSSTVSLLFLLGNINGDITTTSVFIDNVLLEETTGVDVTPDTNQILRGDFELLPIEYTTTDADILAACRPQESRLNTTYTGFANSLITVEYYDTSNNIKRESSAAYINVDSDLMKVNGDDSHYRLDIDYKKLDIEISVHIYFDDDGIRYEIRDEEITGEGANVLAAIVISPFLGASGGAYNEFDLTEMDYSDEDIFKYAVPGYALIPDGSGTLIRFSDNDVKLDDYNGRVYGNDFAQNRLHYNWAESYVPFKQPSMPVFGIAHGNEQSAFVAYATSGEEYMEIISMPEENLTFYNFTYPRFEYNKQYLQVYNKSGWGYLTLFEDRNHFDIDMRYDFLNGDGSTGPSADYVGMAKRYREYLIDNDLLQLFDPTYSDIPLRLDFLMSDVEKAVTGYSNQVTTTTDGVDRILQQMIGTGITNINVGLLGWNDGGLTIGDPSKTDFTREIGRKRDFENLIELYQDQEIDISFQDDYYSINEDMMSLRKNAAKHINSWYANIDTFEEPINFFYFARPQKSIEWLLDHTSDFDNLGVSSYSIAGVTNNLISDYTNDTTREKAKQLIIDGFGELDPDKLVNSYEPNSYLWQFTDRYIGTPVYGTQFLIETDTVPFLQLVLQDSMELYGPYSNFSFYTDKDVLRMIDYNVYPNFVLTEEPAYLLTDTNSRSFYSTQYLLYEELITSIYGRVNSALGSVIGSEWVDRTVVENGVIVNTYANGIEIVINYTDSDIMYGGELVTAVSFTVVGD